MNRGFPAIIGTMIAATVLPAVALGQAKSDSQVKTVLVSGRVLSPDGQPWRSGISMARIEPDGFLTEEQTANPDALGIFSFHVLAGEKYRIHLTSYGIGTRKTVDTTDGTDVDVGDVILARCPAPKPAIPVPTPVERIGDLKLEQIVIEPQKLGDWQWTGIRAPDPPVSQKPGPSHQVELPPCWTGPSLESRADWEKLCPYIIFDRPVSVESFVGGKVRVIRVIQYDPRLSSSQIREEVRKVWLGRFTQPSCRIDWAEWSPWNIAASVEYEANRA